MKNELDVGYQIQGYLPTWEEGRQVKFNHMGCPAGEDVKGRLGLKAILPRGSWVGHCFNCNRSGAYFTGGKIASLTDLMSTPDASHATITDDDPGASARFSQIMKESGPITDLRIKAWLYRYDLVESDWEKLKLRQMPGIFNTEANLIIPITGESGQIRTFNSGAKYYTYIKEKGNHCYSNWFESTRSELPIIITEDIISAYRVQRDLKIEGLALLGTNLTDSCLKVLEGSTGTGSLVYIWLDGDAAGRKASTEVFRQVGMKTSAKPIIVLADKSPKEYNREEIQDAFDKGTDHSH
jgi:hypothetical protein